MTVLKFRYWILIGVIVGFLSGCAAEPKYTQRTCIVNLIGQVGPGAVLTTLVCEKEEPYKAAE